MEPEDELAMGYLASQFPSDYPEDKPPAVSHVQTQEEKDKAESDKAIALSKKALEKANDLKDDLDKQQEAEKESKQSVLQIAGMDYNNVQLSPLKQSNTLNLAQLNSNTDQSQSLKEQIASLSSLDLSQEQLEYL